MVVIDRSVLGKFFQAGHRRTRVTIQRHMAMGPGIEDNHDDVFLVPGRCVAQLKNRTRIDPDRDQGDKFQEFPARETVNSFSIIMHDR